MRRDIKQNKVTSKYDYKDDYANDADSLSIFNCAVVWKSESLLAISTNAACWHNPVILDCDLRRVVT